MVVRLRSARDHCRAVANPTIYLDSDDRTLRFFLDLSYVTNLTLGYGVVGVYAGVVVF